MYPPRILSLGELALEKSGIGSDRLRMYMINRNQASGYTFLSDPTDPTCPSSSICGRQCRDTATDSPGDTPGTELTKRARASICSGSSLNTRHKRHANPDVLVNAAQGKQILQNDGIRNARPLPVQVFVHDLQVIEEKIGQRRDGKQVFPWDVARRVDGRVNSFRPACFQQVLKKKRLHERLAAGERHAAAGLARRTCDL